MLDLNESCRENNQLENALTNVRDRYVSLAEHAN